MSSSISSPLSAAANSSSKVWNRFKDKVNRNGIVRRISIRRSSRVKKYSLDDEERGPDSGPVSELLAQVYSLSVDGEEQRWERVIDEVVRISVICEQESPKCIYRVTASDTDYQGIIEAYITLPGTQLTRCTPTFIQWKDPEEGGAWGLNFVLEDEAEKFIDLCTPKDESVLKRSNSQVDISNAEIPAELTHPICLPDVRPIGDGDTPLEGPTREDLDLQLSDSEDTMEGKFGFKSKDSIADKRHTALPISGGVRRLLASRKKERQIKYATYSPKRSGNLRSSYYDNVDDNDYPQQNGENALLRSSELSYSQDGYIQDCDVAINLNRKVSASEICVEGISAPGTINNSLAPPGATQSRTPSPRRYATGSHNTSPRVRSAIESSKLRTPNLPLGPGVLKSAKFIEDNAANFELANTIRVAGHHHETLNGNFISPNKSRTLTYNHAHSTSFDSSPNAVSKAKRSQSFNSRLSHAASNDNVEQRTNTNSLTNDNSIDKLDRTERYLDDVGAMLQEYETHLRNVQDNSDSGFDGTLPESESLTNHSASSSGHVQPPVLPNGKWRKRKAGPGTIGGSDSGSSSGMRGDAGTLTSSEGRHSQHDVDFLDSPDGKEFFIHDEDDENLEEEDESQSLSSITSQASCYQQGGATRKAGWLNVKSMLVQRKRKLERATKRTWKEYWVCLKGTMLLFYACPEKTAPDENSEPRHILVVENGLAQAVPEHPKRDNIFCLSTAFGDTYLLQANNQIELENWVTAIHSACSSAFARQHGKDDTLRLIRSQSQKLEDQLDQENKTKKMAELQLMTVSDAKNRQAIVNQISQWEQNLEKLHLEWYRLRCYGTSLQGTELPNPKTLLACVGKQTKATLGRLGIFSVSSFHALVSARNPAGIKGRFSKPKSKKHSSFFGTLKKHKDKHSHQGETTPNSAPVVGDHEDYEGEEEGPPEAPDFGENEQDYNEEMLGSHDDSTASDQLNEGALVKVLLPGDQSSMVTVKPGMTVLDLLISSCTNRKMDYHNYYVRFNLALRYGASYIMPDKTGILYEQKYDEIEICSKSIHQVELYKFDDNMSFGLALEAELGDDMEQEDQLCVFISSLESGGLAYHQDLQVGDEILVINGRVVCDLDMLFIEHLLGSSTALTLTVRSCRSVYAQTQAMQDTNRYIDQLTCPPPPSQTRLTDEMIDNLIVPAPAGFSEPDTNAKEQEDQQKEEEKKEEEEIPDYDTVQTILDKDGIPLPLVYDPADDIANHISNFIDSGTPSVVANGTTNGTIKGTANGVKTEEEPPLDNKQIEQLMKNAEQVTEFCRTLDFRQSVRRNRPNGTGGRLPGQQGPGNDGFAEVVLAAQAAQKLRKVIMELLDTEKAYVRDLNCLVTRYLEPLQSEAFLTADEIDALFGNVKEIIKFQTTFLKSLEDPVAKETKFTSLSDPEEFKRILLSIGRSFLFYMEHFKLYSAFCACHSRSQKILDPAKGNSALMQFLEARNPKQQHSASLASYLIKPIQRVLKYPLLLSEMRTHLDRDAYEHYHLSEALKGMNKVAEHINDMMRVHEEFGAVFDTLVAEQYHIKKEMAGSKVHELAMDDLVKYETMTWLNCHDDLPKHKKGREPEVTVFVFRPAVVIVCKERSRKKSMAKLSATGTLRGNPMEEVRFKWMVPTSSMQVKETNISETDYLCLWELIHTKAEGKTEKQFQFSSSSVEQKSSFVKTVRQVVREYHRSKNMPGGSAGSKFNAKKTYGGKRFDTLTRPKRTLRKTGAKPLSDGGSSAGQSEAGSLGSEERSSESGSHRSVDGDRGDETDSTSTTGTGRGSYNPNPLREPTANAVMPRPKSDGALNSNGNNNSVNRGDAFIPVSPSTPSFPYHHTTHDSDRTLTPSSTPVTPGYDDNLDVRPRALTLDLSALNTPDMQRQLSTSSSEPYTPNLEDIRARLAEIEMTVQHHH